MMKKFLNVSVLALVVLTSALALAQNPVPGKAALDQKMEAIPAMPFDMTVTGQNICLGCTMKKERGAGAECTTFGHKHAMRTNEVTTHGKVLPRMHGWILHYLETDKSKELIKQHDGEIITVMGKFYPEERVFEVTSFQPANLMKTPAASSENPMTKLPVKTK